MSTPQDEKDDQATQPGAQQPGAPSPSPAGIPTIGEKHVKNTSGTSPTSE